MEQPGQQPKTVGMEMNRIADNNPIDIAIDKSENPYEEALTKQERALFTFLFKNIRKIQKLPEKIDLQRLAKVYDKKTGNNLLHICVECNNQFISKLLYDYAYLQNKPNNNGFTPLQLAHNLCKKKGRSCDMLKVLNTPGVDTKSFNNFKKNKINMGKLPNT